MGPSQLRLGSANRLSVMAGPAHDPSGVGANAIRGPVKCRGWQAQPDILFNRTQSLARILENVKKDKRALSTYLEW